MRSDGDPAYRVAAGDVLEISRPGKPLEKTEVHNDGSIHISRNPPIRVDDKTISEIQEEIEQTTGMGRDACRVAVSKYNSQFIYVFGDTRQESPRAIPYQGRETLREFLTRVGCRNCVRGFRARVVRPGQRLADSPELVAVKLDAELYNRDKAADPVFLRPNDYVYLERDGSGPGGLVPKGGRFWPFTKFTFRNWKRQNASERDYAPRADLTDEG